MLLKLIAVIGLIGFVLGGCSTSPNAANCYGKGQLECEAYWKDSPPKSVVIAPNIDDDFIKKHNIPNKQMYINRNEVLPVKWWKKIGISEFETRKAILECGSTIYWDKGEFELMKALSLAQYDNGLVSVKRCMLNDGFTYSGNFDPCVLNTEIPACLASAITLKRNISYRLDSAYCITTPTLHERIKGSANLIHTLTPIFDGKKLDGTIIGEIGNATNMRELAQSRGQPA